LAVTNLAGSWALRKGQATVSELQKLEEELHQAQVEFIKQFGLCLQTTRELV